MCNVHVTAFVVHFWQLCRLHTTKLKKNVIVAACDKHGNACISSSCPTAHEITYNNFKISLVVFMPNITTNHAITYTNSKGKIKSKIFVIVWRPWKNTLVWSNKSKENTLTNCTIVIWSVPTPWGPLNNNNNIKSVFIYI